MRRKVSYTFYEEQALNRPMVIAAHASPARANVNRLCTPCIAKTHDTVCRRRKAFVIILPRANQSETQVRLQAKIEISRYLAQCTECNSESYSPINTNIDASDIVKRPTNTMAATLISIYSWFPMKNVRENQGLGMSRWCRRG